MSVADTTPVSQERLRVVGARQVRIWNYLDKTCRLKKKFDVELSSVSFHPSGFYVLVGMADKLRLFNVAVKDLVQLREFHVPGCKVRWGPDRNPCCSQTCVLHCARRRVPCARPSIGLRWTSEPAHDLEAAHFWGTCSAGTFMHRVAGRASGRLPR